MEHENISFIQKKKMWLIKVFNKIEQIKDTYKFSFVKKIISDSELFRLPQWLRSKIICLQCRRHRRCEFSPWVRKIPWRRKWLQTPVFLPKKFHGQRTRMGCSPWSCKVSDTTEQTYTYIYNGFTFPHTWTDTTLQIIYTPKIFFLNSQYY